MTLKPHRQAMSNLRRGWGCALAAAMIAAGWLHLKSVGSGVLPEELMAYDVARGIAAGEPPPLLLNSYMLPFYEYALAPLTELGPISARLLAKAGAVGSIGLTFVLTRLWLGTTPALWASALFGGSTFLFYLSSHGAYFQTPLWSLLTLTLFSAGWKRASGILIAASGLSFGLEMGFLLFFSITPLVIGLFCLLAGTWRRTLRVGLWFVLGSSVVLLPLGWSLLRNHPSDLFLFWDALAGGGPHMHIEVKRPLTSHLVPKFLEFLQGLWYCLIGRLPLWPRVDLLAIPLLFLCALVGLHRHANKTAREANLFLLAWFYSALVVLSWIVTWLHPHESAGGEIMLRPLWYYLVLFPMPFMAIARFAGATDRGEPRSRRGIVLAIAACTPFLQLWTVASEVIPVQNANQRAALDFIRSRLNHVDLVFSNVNIFNYGDLKEFRPAIRPSQDFYESQGRWLPADSGAFLSRFPYFIYARQITDTYNATLRGEAESPVPALISFSDLPIQPPHSPSPSKPMAFRELNIAYLLRVTPVGRESPRIGPTTSTSGVDRTEPALRKSFAGISPIQTWNFAGRRNYVLYVVPISVPTAAPAKFLFEPRADESLPGSYAGTRGQLFLDAIGFGWDHNLWLEEVSAVDAAGEPRRGLSSALSNAFRWKVGPGRYVVTLTWFHSCVGDPNLMVENVPLRLLPAGDCGTGGRPTTLESSSPVEVSDGRLDLVIQPTPGGWKTWGLVSLEIRPIEASLGAR
ncbi:MAG: hypothetical protein HYT87_11760 [Nitrospirae bacterium]|nr:hypothetical protein [Nitrospirota bacterium]